jgi:YtkA-like
MPLVKTSAATANDAPSRLAQQGSRSALVAILLVVAACSQANGPTATLAAQSATVSGSGLIITLQTEPDPPHSGDNVISVTVKQQDGAPLTNATVAAVFYMPAMPSMGMPEMRSAVPLTHQSDGRYVGTGNLVMSGTWNTTVTVARRAESLGSGKFTIIAR